MKQRSWELNSFKKHLQTALDAEAKAALWLCFYIRNINQYYLWDNRPAYSIITKILPQDYQIKDP